MQTYLPGVVGRNLWKEAKNYQQEEKGDGFPLRKGSGLEMNVAVDFWKMQSAFSSNYLQQDLSTGSTLPVLRGLCICICSPINFTDTCWLHATFHKRSMSRWPNDIICVIQLYERAWFQNVWLGALPRVIFVLFIRSRSPWRSGTAARKEIASFQWLVAAAIWARGSREEAVCTSTSEFAAWRSLGFFASEIFSSHQS